MTAKVSDYKDSLYHREYGNDVPPQTNLIKRVTLPVKWQELYEEAADLLLKQEDDYLFDREASLTPHTVAAMCLEKIPQKADLAKDLYKKELASWLEGFSEYREEGLKERDLFEQACWIVQTLEATKGGKFLAIKAERQDVYLMLAELEIDILEKWIIAISEEVAEDASLEEAEFVLILICLHRIACQSVIQYLGDSDAARTESFKQKTLKLEKCLALDQHPMRCDAERSEARHRSQRPQIAQQNRANEVSDPKEGGQCFARTPDGGAIWQSEVRLNGGRRGQGFTLSPDMSMVALTKVWRKVTLQLWAYKGVNFS